MEDYGKEILNAGGVELLSIMGSDIDIVNAARVSFSSYEEELTDKGKGLINYLIKNKHATPFEHVVFKFFIKAPIFVAREWFRHRWSSFNEMSMRYHVPAEIDFYIPDPKNIRTQVGKPGNYTFEEIQDESIKELTIQRLTAIYDLAYICYKDLLEAGVAKEIARSVLPVGQYTEFVWTVNLRSLLNFLNLRNSEHAQFEISEYARYIETIVADLLPATYESWIANNREAI
jgi:thymidylate synthase (FAD)